MIGNTERITEIQNKLQKRKWEGFCIFNVKYLNISKTIKIAGIYILKYHTSVANFKINGN